MNNYKSIIYKSYRTTFKGDISDKKLDFIADKMIPIIKPLIIDFKKSARIVDLGCGAGELLRAFARLGFTNVSGCDLSPEQVTVAKKLFPDIAEEDLFSYLEKMPDHCLEIVTAFDVIEHLGPELTFRLFREIKRVLTSGGIFIVHCPNGVSPFVGSVYWGDMTHEWCLTPDSARTLCSIHGMFDFKAVEHLGESSGIAGRIRLLCWLTIRSILNIINIIETGVSQPIWTRNFSFSCKNYSVDLKIMN